MLIQFHKDFYPQKIIEESLQSYNQLCTGNIKENEKYFIVNLFPKQKLKKEEEEKLKHEFCNYVLASSKKYGINPS